MAKSDKKFHRHAAAFWYHKRAREDNPELRDVCTRHVDYHLNKADVMASIRRMRK